MNIHFVTRAFGTARLAMRAQAPTLMVGAGVASMGAAVITASKRTLHIDEVLEDYVKTLETIETGLDNPRLGSYTPEKARSDRYKTYARASFAVVKHYAVPIVLFGGGAGLVFSGHRVMLKRNAALAVAFTTVQKALEQYRANVREAMGPKFDRAMSASYTMNEVHDGGTGKVTTVPELEWSGEGADPYFRIFEQGESTMWRNDLGINKDFIETQTQYAQQLLNRRGYLYLSEAYHGLGMEETPISRLVGWKVNRLPDGTKDIPTVDFGLNTPHTDDWKYSRENAIYLDFNCQGLIIGGVVQKIMEDA